jgi:hypothetical protein
MERFASGPINLPNLSGTYPEPPERLPPGVPSKKNPDSGGFLEADEGTRTLDLLHGKVYA